MNLELNGMRLSRLPKNKTAVQVFGDFLGYLFRCTRNFIRDTHANGAALWGAVEKNIQFILSHPNGWQGAEQAKIRAVSNISPSLAPLTLFSLGRHLRRSYSRYELGKGPSPLRYGGRSISSQYVHALPFPNLLLMSIQVAVKVGWRQKLFPYVD